MVNAPQPIFYKRPKPFDGVCMHFANHIDLFAVIDSAVLVAPRIEAVVGRKVVRKDNGLRQNVLFNQPKQRIGLNVSRDHGAHFALALNHADNGCLAVPITDHRATRVAFALTTEESLIHLDSTIESANRPGAFRVQHGANLFEHSPRGFVRYARLALDLLRRNAAASRSHQVDGVEPSRKRRGGFMENRSRRWVDVMTAMVARVGRAAVHAVMLRDLFAVLAVDA